MTAPCEMQEFRMRRSRPPTYTPKSQGPPSWLGLALIAGVVLLVVLIVWIFLARPSQTATVPTPTAAILMPSLSTVQPTGVSPTVTFTPTPAVLPPELTVLQQTLLDTANAQRRAAGMALLETDQPAGTASARHAQEMVDFGYESLMDLDGHSPSYRYYDAGGHDMIRQHVLLVGEILPTSVAAWQEEVKNAASRLLARPETHADLLAPTTHLGVGFAYNKETSQMAVVVSFVARFVELDMVPQRANLGQSTLVSGRLLRSANAPELRLTYEPQPSQRSVTDLNNGAPLPHLESCLMLPLHSNPDSSFSQEVTLNCDSRSGLYHIQISVDTPDGRIDAIDQIVEVR
jgi:uncharacterized protein YkwD